MKEIFDEFTGRKTPYTYDTLLRKQTEQSRTNLRNSWDEPDYQYYNNTEDRKFLRVASIGSSSEVGIQPKNTLRGFYNSSSHFDIAVKATASKDKAQTTYLRTRDLADIIKNWTDIRSLRGTFRLSAQSDPTGNSTTFGTITSSSNYFSDEFVYASVVLLAIFFAAFIGFLLKTMMKNALGSDEEEELKIAVTTEMRQLRYDPNTSDSHDVDQPRVGIRFRARTPTSAPKRSSTSTNTFLLISPNSVIEDSIQTKDTTDKH